MANHIKNIVICQETHESTIAEVCDYVKDFARLVPAPSNILTQHEQDAHAQATRNIPASDILTDILYYWRLEHWGTKWEGYRYKDVEGGISFETAWSHPLPIIKSLARQFPHVPLSISYASEDIGFNFGAYTIHGDVITCDRPVPNENTKEAYQFGCRIWQHDFTEWVAEFVGEIGYCPWEKCL